MRPARFSRPLFLRGYRGRNWITCCCTKRLIWRVGTTGPISSRGCWARRSRCCIGCAVDRRRASRSSAGAACDDWVVARTRSARPYVHSLVRLYELRFAQRQAVRRELLSSGIFGGGSRLGERIETLLRRGGDFAPRASARSVAAGIAGCLIAAGVIASLSPDWIALAQAPKPAFDVASIKQHTGQTNGVDFEDREGGRLNVVNNPISNVIRNAYGIRPPYQLIGCSGLGEFRPLRHRSQRPGNRWTEGDDAHAANATCRPLRDAGSSRNARDARVSSDRPTKGGPKATVYGSRRTVRSPSTVRNPNRKRCRMSAATIFCWNNGWHATHTSMLGR